MKFIEFTTRILKFDDNGDKTNWSYITVTAAIAARLKPGHKKSFRVQGMLDDLAISQTALLPAGDGKFMLPINATMRKQLRKQAGASLKVRLAAEEVEPPMDEELLQCLQEDKEALERFTLLTKSHQRYFSNWVASAKTTSTRDARIAHTLNAMIRGWDYGQMIRALKKDIG